MLKLKLYRSIVMGLAQNPKRLWRRYLVDDPAILQLLWREVRNRR
jgi:N-acetylglucosaminyldiphosphoundecaprenol N-acetyl-beta-D-mannosaminyltransferase